LELRYIANGNIRDLRLQRKSWRRDRLILLKAKSTLEKTQLMT